jgi:hypothetical protein
MSHAKKRQRNLKTTFAKAEIEQIAHLNKIKDRKIK